MQLTLENPDFRYTLRGADGRGALVNEQRLETSFILAPNQLIQDWRPRAIADLRPEDLLPLLDLSPSVVLLGSGASLVFPSAAVMAACLTRGIGMEVMDNAAAARTFNVLATEGRKVVAAFLL
ncbi:MAG: Mth938-like domain-containing protein [Gammaproteobacteria bacterium]|jgi:uncharacterized protein|nr:Mth938-like domain-containing protein [Gammaproteobacteria bacterium]